MVEILGVVKLSPVPKLAPPLDAAYQLTVPSLDFAVKITVPVSHREADIYDVIDIGAKILMLLVTLAAAQPPVEGIA